MLNAAPFDERLRSVLPLIDVLICNELEAAALLGQPTTRDGRAMARSLSALVGSAAIVTLGAAGAAYAAADIVGELRPPRVIAVDSTAAGDAFCGAVAAWLAAGSPLEDAVRAGVALERWPSPGDGAQPSLPLRAEIEQLLRAAEKA